MSTLLRVLQGTLPGFPSAPTPSLLEALMIMLIIPAVIGVVIMGWGMGRTWLKADREASEAEVERGTLSGGALPGGASRAERPALDASATH